MERFPTGLVDGVHRRRVPSTIRPTFGPSLERPIAEHAAQDVLNPWRLARMLTRPSDAGDLSRRSADVQAVLLRLVIPASMLPPLFAYIGGSTLGWRLGADEPLTLSTGDLTLISFAYFLALIAGFASTAAVAVWMSGTYGARRDFGTHLAFVAFVGMPVVLASAAHLLPHAFVNILVLIPALIWSLYLLYRCLPEVLGTSPEQGMLMASALVGYLLVAFVSLLGITVALWSGGIGPVLGV